MQHPTMYHSSTAEGVQVCCVLKNIVLMLPPNVAFIR